MYVLEIASLISGTRFGSWFPKKVSQGARFLTMVSLCTKSLNKIYKNIVYQNFQFFQTLNWLHMEYIMVFINMNMWYILLKSRNFKTFLRENYAVALGRYCMFNLKLNIMLILLIPFLSLRPVSSVRCGMCMIVCVKVPFRVYNNTQVAEC